VRPTDPDSHLAGFFACVPPHLDESTAASLLANSLLWSLVMGERFAIYLVIVIGKLYKELLSSLAVLNPIVRLVTLVDDAW